MEAFLYLTYKCHNGKEEIIGDRHVVINDFKRSNIGGYLDRFITESRQEIGRLNRVKIVVITNIKCIY